MKRLFTLSVFALLSFSVFGQSGDTCRSAIREPFSLRFSAGTGLMTGRGFSAMNTFVSPGVTYTMNKRFSLQAGFTVMNTTFSTPFAGNRDLQNKSKASGNLSTFVYAGGSYQLNKRVTLSGYAYTQINPYGKTDTKNQYETQLKGAAFGMDYKLSEKSSIGVEFNFSEKHSPFSHNNMSCFPTQTGFYGK